MLENSRLEKFEDFAFFREAAEFLFGEDQLSVEGDFKYAAARRDQREFTDFRCKVSKQFVRQPDGCRQVVSHVAVGKCDHRFFHVQFPLEWLC